MGMLVITRREGEEVELFNPDGSKIGTVRVATIKGDRTRLAFDFPREVEIVRPDAKNKQRKEAMSHGNRA